MTTCILDASAALCLLAPNQATAAGRAFAAELPADLRAPEVFSVEVRNALVKLERRGHLAMGAADSALSALEAGMALIPPSPARWPYVMDRARRRNLGVYDAVYLELALRHDAALATRDQRLLQEARQLHVAVKDLR